MTVARQRNAVEGRNIADLAKSASTISDAVIFGRTQGATQAKLPRKVKFRPHCFQECLHTTALFLKSTLSLRASTMDVYRTSSYSLCVKRRARCAGKARKSQEKYSPGINRFHQICISTTRYCRPRSLLQNLSRHLSLPAILGIASRGVGAAERRGGRRKERAAFPGIALRAERRSRLDASKSRAGFSTEQNLSANVLYSGIVLECLR